MEKRLLSACVLLMVLASSIVPITLSDVHVFSGIETNGTVFASMYELVEILEDGSCRLEITMTAMSPSLVTVYERAFDFDGENDTLYPVDFSIPVEGEITFNSTVTVLEAGTTNVVGAYPANSSLMDGVRQQQLLSLGIDITSWGYVRMLKETATGHFLVFLEAYGEFLQFENSGGDWSVTIGPSTCYTSCDHASYLLTQVAYIQELLGNLTENTYNNVWTTQISRPDAASYSNFLDLLGTTWGPYDFGNTSASVTAEILPLTSGDALWLEEEMTVTENEVSKTESELWQDLFNYKIFKIQYGSLGGAACFEGKYVSTRDSEDFSWGVHFTILNIENQRFEVEFGDPSGKVTVTMEGSFNVSLSAHVGFRTEWFKLKKFYGYVKLTGSLVANFTVELNSVTLYDNSWDKDIFEWSGNKYKPPTFWIGTVPVWLIPHFKAKAKFSLNIESTVTFGCGAEVNGWVKAGVGWKKRFYPIFEAGMDVSNKTNAWRSDESVRIEARPSLGFIPSVMFYDAAGPAIEIEPYLRVIFLWTSSKWQLSYIAGVCLNVGISFSGWFKKITGLNDWFPATIFDWELWMDPPREPHDIAVAKIESEGHAFVGETATITVDVVNLGATDEDNVTVTLYHSLDGSNWQPIPNCTKTDLGIPDMYCRTLNFTWETVDLVGGDYILNATATINDEDADYSNNNKTQSFRLNVQDIAVIDLVADPEQEEIVTTVNNVGTGNLSSVVVLLYYDGYLIGDEWWNHTRMAFNLNASKSTRLYFDWDMIAHYDLSKLAAEALQLEYESSTEDNMLEGARLVYDVNGDNYVGIDDILAVASHFAQDPSHLEWNPIYDINGDNYIGIDDLFAVASHFGEEY